MDDDGAGKGERATSKLVPIKAGRWILTNWEEGDSNQKNAASTVGFCALIVCFVTCSDWASILVLYCDRLCTVHLIAMLLRLLDPTPKSRKWDMFFFVIYGS